MYRDNAYNQSDVAYENGPKEVNTEEPIPGSKKQFGNGNRMPQENKGYKQKEYPANPMKRGGEYR